MYLATLADCMDLFELYEYLLVLIYFYFSSLATHVALFYQLLR